MIPNYGQGMPVNDGWIARKFADIERALTELRAARTLDSSTISPNGTLTVDGALTVAGALDVSGNLNVTGHAAIAGTLSLPDGIIDNAALANPTAFGQQRTTVPSVALGTSFASVGTATITVPSGFTQALLIIHGILGVASTVATDTVVQLKLVINGTDQGFYPLSTIKAGADGTVEFPSMTVLTGLTGGGSITTDLQANAQPTTLPSADCAAVIEATAIFLR